MLWDDGLLLLLLLLRIVDLDRSRGASDSGVPIILHVSVVSVARTRPIALVSDSLTLSGSQRIPGFRWDVSRSRARIVERVAVAAPLAVATVLTVIEAPSAIVPVILVVPVVPVVITVVLVPGITVVVVVPISVGISVVRVPIVVIVLLIRVCIVVVRVSVVSRTTACLVLGIPFIQNGRIFAKFVELRFVGMGQQLPSHASG